VTKPTHIPTVTGLAPTVTGAVLGRHPPGTPSMSVPLLLGLGGYGHDCTLSRIYCSSWIGRCRTQSTGCTGYLVHSDLGHDISAGQKPDLARPGTVILSWHLSASCSSRPAARYRAGLGLAGSGFEVPAMAVAEHVCELADQFAGHDQLLAAGVL
jgi:hypothetical protein